MGHRRGLWGPLRFHLHCRRVPTLSQPASQFFQSSDLVMSSAGIFPVPSSCSQPTCYRPASDCTLEAADGQSLHCIVGLHTQPCCMRAPACSCPWPLCCEACPACGTSSAPLHTPGLQLTTWAPVCSPLQSRHPPMLPLHAPLLATFINPQPAAQHMHAHDLMRVRAG